MSSRDMGAPKGGRKEQQSKTSFFRGTKIIMFTLLLDLFFNLFWLILSEKKKIENLDFFFLWKKKTLIMN